MHAGNKSHVADTVTTAFESNSGKVISHFDLGYKVKSVNVSHSSLGLNLHVRGL